MGAIPALPHDLGPYRLDSLLGSGGMGDVYRAHDRRLHRHVAVKHLRTGTGLLEEARAAAQLNHPAIVQVFDVLETADGGWIVMELVEGETVAARLEAERFDVQTAVSLGRQVAGGLAEAHRAGVLHGDLKAENVMVTKNGRAKILDFGLARPLKRDGITGTDGSGAGTYRTMSPEQARGLPLDTRSDLFSLGVLLYEMATGVSPFQAASRDETLARICTHHQRSAHLRHQEVPLALSTLIDQLLEKAPEHRPESAERVVTALRLIDGRPASNEAHDVSTAGWIRDDTVLDPLAPPPKKRHLARWGLAATIVVAAMVAAGVLWWPAPEAATVTTTSEIEASASWSRYQEGMALLERFDREGYVERASQLFEELVESDPDHASAHAGLARAYWRRGRETRDESWFERALPIAERAVELDGHLAVAQTSLGLVLAELGRRDEARQAFEQALVLAPEHAEAHRGLGEVAQYDGDLDQAVAHLERAVAAAPDNRRFYDKLGSLLYRRGDLEAAATAFERSIELTPDAEFGYRNLAAVRYSQGKLDQAATLLQKALEIRPKAAVYTNLGTLLFVQGRYQEAVAPFEKAVSLDEGSRSALMWGNLGDAYRWAPGREADAERAYGRAVELLREQLATRPDDPEPKSRLALFLAKGGECREAADTTTELDRVDDPGGRIRFRLAVAHEVCGRRQAALTTLEQALDAGYPRAAIDDEVELRELAATPAVRAWRPTG